MNSFVKLLNHVLVFVFLILLLSCARQPQFYTMEDFARVPKIDAHVHINTEDPAFIQQARSDNFKLLTINVDYPDFPPFDKQQETAVRLLKEYPLDVAYASTFAMTGWDAPDWDQKVISHIDRTVAEGAIAVKVWKNIGMDFRDQAGELVMIDNPGFDPIFNHLREINTVLIGHMGEPKNCWLPFEEMTVNNDKEYFKHHPQYHMYLHPEFPSYEEQMAARDRMLDKNLNLTFMGAHLASLEWSVDEVGKFLERYPAAVVDMAARSGQVQYQSSRDREKVRQFFISYQDRVLYATDITYEAGANPDTFKLEVHEKWLTDWKYFTTDSTMSVPELDTAFQGLALPRMVVDKIYYQNARRTFPTAWKKAD